MELGWLLGGAVALDEPRPSLEVAASPIGREGLESVNDC